jgi:RimJ/RimL family protein N-acetyltransferase
MADHWLAPDPWRTRFNLRPRPWLNGYFMLAIRRMGSDDIIGYGSLLLEDGAVDYGLAIRPDQRRAGLALPATRVVEALVHDHFGYRRMTAATANDNVPAQRALDKLGFVYLATTERAAPDGSTMTMRQYESARTDSVRRCRWGMTFGLHGWPRPSSTTQPA